MSHEMVWTLIHEEREALLADLEGLTDEQWRTASLCDGWTIQQVVAHLVSSASLSKAEAAKELLKAKGDFETIIQAGVVRFSAGSPAETLEAFKAVLHDRVCPLTPDGMLGETLVHSEDIRRPLGIERHHPAETLRQVADYYKDSRVGGAKDRVADVHLMATDQQWDHGKGEIVEGPLLPLVMTMTGREEFLDDLTGEGMLTYRARFTK